MRAATSAALAADDLTLAEARVLLVVLTEVASWSRLRDRVTRGQLAAAASVSTRTVSRALSRLEELGAVEVVRGNGRGKASTVGLPGVHQPQLADPEKGDTQTSPFVETAAPVKGDTHLSPFRPEKGDTQMSPSREEDLPRRPPPSPEPARSGRQPPLMVAVAGGGGVPDRGVRTPLAASGAVTSSPPATREQVRELMVAVGVRDPSAPALLRSRLGALLHRVDDPWELATVVSHPRMCDDLSTARSPVAVLAHRLDELADEPSPTMRAVEHIADRERDMAVKVREERAEQQRLDAVATRRQQVAARWRALADAERDEVLAEVETRLPDVLARRLRTSKDPTTPAVVGHLVEVLDERLTHATAGDVPTVKPRRVGATAMPSQSTASYVGGNPRSARATPDDGAAADDPAGSQPQVMLDRARSSDRRAS